MKMSILSVTIFALLASMTHTRVLSQDKLATTPDNSKKSDKSNVVVSDEKEIRTKLDNEIKKEMIKDNESNSSENESASKKSIVAVDTKNAVVDTKVEVIETKEIKSKKSSEDSSLKTDPSMKDFDLKDDNKSKNSDVISETVLNQGSQVLDEKSSEVDQDEKTKKDKSESLKITSAFISVITLIALF